MKVFARQGLVDADLAPEEAAVLLEGAWCPGRRRAPRWSLDESIDARFAWIDLEASRFAERMAQSCYPLGCYPLGCYPLGFLNELKLRYYFVKLLRVAAFFGERDFGCDTLHVHLTRDRDEDYAALFQALCAAGHFELRLHWSADGPAPVSLPPANPRWRRLGGKLNNWLAPRWSDRATGRFVLCGSRGVLAPVCAELLRQHAQVAWLYDRFAAKTFLRWRMRGVAQLICDADTPTPESIETPGGVGAFDLPCGDGLVFRGLDLAPAVGHWLARVAQSQCLRQQRLLSRIDAHFGRLRPTALVLDEDATPMARAAVAAAHRHGAPSIVVQHGAPRVRFGFAPLAADFIFCWGESSRKQLVGWGVDERRVRVTGSPRHDRLPLITRGAGHPAKVKEILFAATVPPNDARPDAVAFHLTSESHRHMVRIACAAAATIPNIRLIIKLHPRCRDATLFQDAIAHTSRLNARIVRSGSCDAWIRRASCVLNCTSSVGVEAALAGVPVIELIPPASHDLLPASEWGAFGTARTQEELQLLFARALSAEETEASDAQVFAHRTPHGATATQSVVRELFAVTGEFDKRAPEHESERSQERLSAA